MNLRSRTLRRILRSPFEHIIAAFSGASGIALIATAYSTWNPSPSVDAMPAYISVAVGVLYMAGGAVAIAGMQWRGRDVSRGWDTERFGWWLLGSGLLLYTLIVAWSHPGSVFSWGSPASLATGCFLKTIALYVREREDRNDRARLRRGGNL